MSRRCPGVVIVAALLNFIAGVAALLQGGFGFAQCMFLDQKASASVLVNYGIQTMEQQVPGWFALETGKALVVFWLGAMFLFTAVGLLSLRTFARRWAIFWGLMAVVVHLTYLVWQIGWVYPAVTRTTTRRVPHEIVQRHLASSKSLPPPARMSERNETAVVMGAFLAALLFSTHGGCVAFLLSSRRVRKAFEPVGRRRNPNMTQLLSGSES